MVKVGFLILVLVEKASGWLGYSVLPWVVLWFLFIINMLLVKLMYKLLVQYVIFTGETLSKFRTIYRILFCIFLVASGFWENLECYRNFAGSKKFYSPAKVSIGWRSNSAIYLMKYTNEQTSTDLLGKHEQPQ